MRIHKIAGAMSIAALSLAWPGTGNAADLDKTLDDCRKAMQMKVYAQVNRAALFASTGSTNETFFVDNDNSSTRFGFKGKANINCDVAVGAKLEVETESNNTADISFRQSGTSGFALKERHFDTWISHSSLGKLSLGQGDTASNGTTEVDLSGTTVISYSGMVDFMGGLEHAFSTGVISTVEIKDVMSQYDGNSRKDRARYDTPKIAGFQASTSVDDDNQWDIAGRYARKFGDTKFAAAVHYLDAKGTSFGGQHGGSASVLFPFGLNVTVAYAGRDFRGRRAGHYYYVKGGFITHPFEDLGLGKTALAIDYGVNKNHAVTGDKAQGYGAYVVQGLIEGVEAYAGVRNHTLSRTGASFKNVFGAMTGLRIKM